MLNFHSFNKRINPDLQSIILDILKSSLKIKQTLSVPIDKNLNLTKSNHGDEQKPVDIISNEILKSHLENNNSILAIASEEEPEIIFINKESNYLVAFDPLDGSSNLSLNLPVGTIFAIYQTTKSELENNIPTGKEILVAGYILYGVSTDLVITFGNNQTNHYVLTDIDNRFEYLLENSKIKLPSNGKMLALNYSNVYGWEKNLQAYINGCLKLDEKNKAGYNMRWVGCMVGDIHRTMFEGGLFLYPADQKNTSGKLRLIYECIPMSFIVVNADGEATNGKQEILGIKPSSWHEKSPFFLGDKNAVKDILKFIS